MPGSSQQHNVGIPGLQERRRASRQLLELQEQSLRATGEHVEEPEAPSLCSFIHSLHPSQC